MRLTISGDCPSKKNNKRIVTNRKTGKPFIISSERHNDWETGAIEELSLQFNGYKVTDYPITISATFYNSSKRRKDLDNQISSVLDVLVKAGVIEDDNVNFIDRLSLKYGGVDKHNPRVEISLED